MAENRWLIDTGASSRFPVYTRLNANDVLPDPITPLGASLAWIPEIFPGFTLGYAAVGTFDPAEVTTEDVWPAAAFFYGHLYVNMSMSRTVGIRNGLGWQAVDAAFFAGHPDAPPHAPRPDDTNDPLAARMAERTQWTLTTSTYPDLEEERAIADRCRAERPDLASMSAGALVARARSMMPLERLMWRGEMLATTQSAVGPAVIAQIVGDPNLVVRLVGHAGEVDSAAPSLALWELSRVARSDADVAAEFDRGMDGLLDRLHAHHAGFSPQFAAFLLAYGYRGPSEWDVGADSWETQPELPLALIDRLRQLDETASPARRQDNGAVQSQAALQQALGQLGEDEETKQTLLLALGSARRFGAWRERAKSNCIKVLHEARVALFELARRLVAQGHLDEPRQLFMALEGELDILVLDPASLSNVLADRQRQWRALFGLQLPTFVQAGEPMTPLSELEGLRHAAEAVAQPGEILQGAPASAGVVRGRARIVHDIGTIADFQPGEILVAPHTDPSWTPLFLVSAGVVVDVGAMQSHAMIVSRELGVPCAAGVPSATRRIPDGALVEVDGSTGRVTILSG